MTTKTQTLTPTPWTMMDFDQGTAIIYDKENTVVIPKLTNKANAAFIVRAVNAHEELLAMVRRLAHFSGCYDNGTANGEPMDFIDYRLNVEALKDEAYKAIAKAEGRS